MIEKLARPNILALKPYSSARSENKNQNITIWLDANENPWPPYGFEQAMSRRYADQQPPGLVTAMSAAYDVDTEQLLITRGADEAIDLLIRVFCEPGIDKILQCSPTFGMYQVAAAIQNCSTVDVSLTENNFQLNTPDIIEKLPAVKLLFLCSPGNPTGNLLKIDDIKVIAQQASQHIIVIDEAYIEFSEEDRRNKQLALIKKYENIVLLRTLSKAYSLAGERIGGMIAHPDIINLCRRVLPPYPLSLTAANMATKALSPGGLVENRQRIAHIVSERQRMEKALQNMPAVKTIYPSDSNFLFMQMHDARLALNALESKGIKARDRSTAIANHIRLSISLPEHNNAVLACLKSL